MSYTAARVRVSEALAELRVANLYEYDDDVFGRGIAALERLREAERLVAQLEADTAYRDPAANVRELRRRP